MVTSSLDETQFLVVGIPAYIAALGAAVAAVVGAFNHRNMRTPSGDKIGHVVERTHDLAAVATMRDTTEPADAMSKSVMRLNSDPEAPVKVERRKSEREPHSEKAPEA